MEVIMDAWRWKIDMNTKESQNQNLFKEIADNWNLGVGYDKHSFLEIITAIIIYHVLSMY